MRAVPVHFSSLDRVAERVLDHLRQGHHTALVGSPGCGMTTFVGPLADRIGANGFVVRRFDGKAKGVTEIARELAAERPAGGQPQVIVLDHVGRLPPTLPTSGDRHGGEHRKDGDLCLWCGNLDARNADRQFGVKLCSVPSAHVSFPMLTRDELLAGYRAIAEDRGCRWGDAVLYLMLDLCGTTWLWLGARPSTCQATGVTHFTRRASGTVCRSGSMTTRRLTHTGPGLTRCPRLARRRWP